MKQRGSLLLAVLGALLGCTAPQPSAEAFEVADPAVRSVDEPVFPGAGLQLFPSPPAGVEEVAEPAAVGTRPHVVVTALPRSSEDEDEYEDYETCPVQILMTGFPAIATDGSAIVFENYRVDSGSDDPMDGVLSVDWIDAKTGDELRTKALTEGWRYHRDQNEHADVDPCIAYAARAKRSARRINRILEENDWRTMIDLDVEVLDPYEDPEYQDERIDPLTLDASVRPVEMFWRDGNLVARTRGVQVYVNEPAPWSEDEDEDEDASDTDYAMSPCDVLPVLGHAHGDPVSGTLLLTVSYSRALTSCLCSNYDYQEVGHAPPALFKRLDRLASDKTPPAVD